MIIDSKEIYFQILPTSTWQDIYRCWAGDESKHWIVKLGYLGLHNATSYYVNKDPKQYPMAWFKDASGACCCAPDKPENCASDETIYMQYDTPLERLIDYAHSLQEEHKDLSDEQLNEYPHGHFNGCKRNARWYDERLRRGLQN